METLIRRIDLRPAQGESRLELLRREWLLTNGLGGYASGRISGSVSRRYHGLLVAALPPPLGRTMMLNHLGEFVVLPGGERLQFGGEEEQDPEGRHFLAEFRLENHLPIWLYDFGEFSIEKRVILLNRSNTVQVSYAARGLTGPACIELRPSLHFRPHDAHVSEPLPEEYSLKIWGDEYEVYSEEDPALTLRFWLRGGRIEFSHERGLRRELSYQTEADRGYDSRGCLWSPGAFRIEFEGNSGAVLVASTEPWEQIKAIKPAEVTQIEIERRKRLIEAAHPAARVWPASELVLAADQFIIEPVGRPDAAARVRAAGDELRTVIAGYYWFTDWGRDTMISLEGLALVTGRFQEAGWILRTFADAIEDGLLPNLYPEGRQKGLYHTADATLWFFQALHRYVVHSGDRRTLSDLLPKLIEIVERHVLGTRFGIGVDPKDGLLRQGAEGYQLTWMDAKVADWVVTPRRGKAVEINALWYNALRLLEGWIREESGETASLPYRQRAEQLFETFNERFWFERENYLYDVVDGENGNDAAFRPNQILAISLAHPVLKRERWKQVVDRVTERLLTPVGLRSLAPGEKDYKERYFGDLRARDAAYHQGTVWSWLIGPYVDAWLKCHPDERGRARQMLDGLLAHLDQACIGNISEVFDAEPPFTPRGCIAQAWGVAEVLRAWIVTEEDGA